MDEERAKLIDDAEINYTNLENELKILKLSSDENFFYIKQIIKKIYSNKIKSAN
ncbi:hypothetical protein [Clostridioides difficile]|uniref:hypothetical protein n=1 Tax=Clostridioides difficile TaxID=1496 RepID=UPI0013579BE2|nr:hypothetical protein [Clostridioides difficile]HBY2626824.1 hypothetical protein [Clostridioides difficile]HBY3614972.1 hypothetical protein [Clostridioides difficile]